MSDVNLSMEACFELGRRNYEELVSFCQRLEKGGLWRQAQRVMKRSCEEVLDLYVQSVLLGLVSYDGPEISQAQQEYILNITNTNPLDIPVREPISEEILQDGQKTAKLPPIVLQLCGVYDRQTGKHMAVDFLDRIINVMLCLLDMSDQSAVELQNYIKGFYHQELLFVQRTDGQVSGDEGYILRKLQVRPVGNASKWLLKEPVSVKSVKGSGEVLEQAGSNAGEEKPAEANAGATELAEPDIGNEKLAETEVEASGTVESHTGRRGKKSQPNKKKRTGAAKKRNVEETERLLRQEMKRQEKEQQEEKRRYEEQERLRLEEEKRQEELAKKRAEEEERKRLEEEQRRLEEEQKRIEEEQRRLEEEQRLAKEEFHKVKKRLMEREKAEREEQERRVGELLAELNELVGLDSVKEEIRSLINLIRVRKMREKMNIPAMDMSYHMVFTGSPGTGKTTVARLVARIYKELGILSQGQLIETDRSRMVAGYVGQTAINVREIVEQAIGGVLFIDEAYSLVSPDSANDYGSEAVDTLVKMMEDHRDDLVVIVAGYTEEMKVFLKSNSGLISRFNKFIAFDDYTNDQLLKILEVMVKKAGLEVEKDAVEEVGRKLEPMTEEDKREFGNARGVRNIFEKMVMNQANRLVQLDLPSRDQLITLTREDVLSLSA